MYLFGEKILINLNFKFFIFSVFLNEQKLEKKNENFHFCELKYLKRVNFC